MQIRCYRCNWNFAIKNEEIAFVVDALEESGGNHYDIRCPRCRTINKISLEQLRWAVPKPEEEEEEEVEQEEGQD